MDGRYWAWLGVRLIVGVVLVGWAFSYLSPGNGNGEKEFQRTLDALKQVHSVRAENTSVQSATQNTDMLWEVSCEQDAYRYKWHAVGNGSEITRDEMHVGNLEYDRQSDDSWALGKNGSGGTTPKALCSRITQGDAGMMPAIGTMIKRGILQKGDKKTVSGVRCREWHVTLRGIGGLEHDTVCLGVDDHLPYEVVSSWQNSHTVYSDYNSLPLALPEAAVQAASATTSSN